MQRVLDMSGRAQQIFQSLFERRHMLFENPKLIDGYTIIFRRESNRLSNCVTETFCIRDDDDLDYKVIREGKYKLPPPRVRTRPVRTPVQVDAWYSEGNITPEQTMKLLLIL